MHDLAACLLYFPIVWLTKALGPMQKGPVFTAMSMVYNVFMVVFSFTSAAIAIEFVWRNRASIPLQCNQAFDENPAYAYTVLAFYLSKYIEWFDTVFLLLRSKPASFLHQFHHIGAPVAVGLLWHTKSESAWIFIGLNGLIHTCMYSYYAACLLGFDVKIIRQSLTSMQLLQFVTGMTLLWVIYEQQRCGEWHRYCFLYQYGYVAIVMALFLNFYVQSYLKPKRSRHDKKDKDGKASSNAAAPAPVAAAPAPRRRSSSPKKNNK